MSSIPYSRFVFWHIPWYSFLIVAGALAAIVLACREERRAGLPKDTVIDLALFLLPGGIIGARLYYVIFSWPQFQHDFLSGREGSPSTAESSADCWCCSCSAVNAVFPL